MSSLHSTKSPRLIPELNFGLFDMQPTSRVGLRALLHFILAPNPPLAVARRRWQPLKSLEAIHD